MFSCTTCAYKTDYKGNLTKHILRCKEGKSRTSKIYSCFVCRQYTTHNKTHFESHQQTELCKRRSEECKTLEDRIRRLEKIIDAHESILKPLIYGE